MRVGPRANRYVCVGVTPVVLLAARPNCVLMSLAEGHKLTEVGPTESDVSCMSASRERAVQTVAASTPRMAIACEVCTCCPSVGSNSAGVVK